MPVTPRQGSPRREFTAPDLVWYASFGSNMHRSRLDCYLHGGCPPGGIRAQPGCRDRRPPERALPLMLPGELYFACESETWTGGIAFYDPLGEGRTAARAWLVTAGQFSDIAAQEMHREPGADLDLREVITSGRQELGPGRYETLICAGTVEDRPVLTFTAPWARGDVPGNAPVAAYLGHLASGLAESHGWPADRIARYLATRPGAAGHWSAEAVAGLMPAQRDAALPG